MNAPKGYSSPGHTGVWGRLPKDPIRPAACILLTILPVIVLMMLIHWAYGLSIVDIAPSHPDDFRNWLIVRNFRDVGFASGYFVHNEVPARWSLTPFAADGPWYAMLFAPLAAIGGWHPYSWVMYNIVLFAVALLFYGIYSRTSGRDLIWMTALVAMLPSIYLGMLASSYTQGYLALGVVMAALFSEMFYCMQQGRGMQWLRLFCVVTVFMASVYKVDWAVLLFPALLLGRRWGRAWFGWGALGVLICLLSASIMFVSGAPIGTQSSTLGFWGQANPTLAALQMILHLLPQNLNIYWKGQLNAQEGLSQAVGLVVLAGFVVPGLWKKGLTLSMRRALLFFNICNILSIFVLINTLYIPYAGVGEKYLTGHWLVSVLAQFRYFSRCMRILLTGMILLIFLVFVRAFGPMTLLYFNALPEARANQFLPQAHELFHYTPGANRWCNTVLDLNAEYPPEILALPSGLGYSVVVDPKRVSFPLKSRYLIGDDSEEVKKLLSANHLRFLGRTRFGSIYENLDAPCPGKAAYER